MDTFIESVRAGSVGIERSGRASGSLSPFRRIVRHAAALWGSLERLRRERQTLHVLYGLSDRTLRDIGVTRGDVHAALYGPGDRSPARAGGAQHRSRRKAS